MLFLPAAGDLGPVRLVLFVDTPGEAHAIRRRVSIALSPKFAGGISIMWGEGWRIYAAGMAKLSDRPFVDLTKATP